MTIGEMFPEDVLRLKSVVASHGYDYTDEEVIELWENHSDTVCAGWLYLPRDDEQLWEIIKSYITTD